MTITTTVTWDDLLSAATDDLGDLREAYDELREQAIEEYGEDALNRTLPSDPEQLDADERDLWVYQVQIQQYDEAAKSIQQREHVLERLRDEYNGDGFKIRMLTGEETVEIETELRMLAQDEDTSIEVIQSKRNTRTVDTATVNAPDGVPHEDGEPKPSQAPNALTLSLWEQINRFNNAGATDFRPEGLGDDTPAPTQTPGSSATPTPSTPSSDDSDA